MLKHHSCKIFNHFDFIIRDQDFFGDWYSSGIVNLSCAIGETGYVAFKYTGSTQDDFDGTYQLDNIRITDNTTNKK